MIYTVANLKAGLAARSAIRAGFYRPKVLLTLPILST